MPIQLPVPGGTAGATNPSSYYANSNAFGEYQFTLQGGQGRPLRAAIRIPLRCIL